MKKEKITLEDLSPHDREQVIRLLAFKKKFKEVRQRPGT